VEILMNLVPPYLAYSLSYRIMSWAGFLCIPVVIDIGQRIDSYIDENPKVCKNLR